MHSNQTANTNVPTAEQAHQSPIALVIAAVISTLFCGLWAHDLAQAWQHSPCDRFGWIAMLLWASPIVQLAARGDVRLRLTSARMTIFVLAVACGAVGSVASLNVLQHFGFALALLGWIGIGWPSLLWLVTAACWWPALGWALAQQLPWQGILGARILLAGLGACVLARSKSSACLPNRAGRLPIKRLTTAACVGGPIALLMISLTWQLLPIAGAEQRLTQLPIQGVNFESSGVPLSPSESKALGDALAVRRLYRFSQARIVATVIDATHNRHAIHDPLYCFTGSGWDIVADEMLPVRQGSIRRVALKKQNRRTEIAYWFTDGEKCHASIAKFWLQATMRRVSAGRSGDEPLLILLQGYDDTPINWKQLLGNDCPFWQI